MSLNLIKHNQEAWDRKVSEGNKWTQPVSQEELREAASGRVSVVLTPQRIVPEAWLGDLTGKRVLCLACGGGQQGPLLAAAGAEVTVFDLSEAQLEQDRRVAVKAGLDIRLEQGEMTDLSRFEDSSFELIFHPVSNCFIPDVRPVWRECYRVLTTEGELLAGFCNPLIFIFCQEAEKKNQLKVRHKIPYSDLDVLSDDELAKKHEPVEFGHTLEQQIAGQLEAGFLLKGLYEDRDPKYPLDKHIDTFLATRAVKH